MTTSYLLMLFQFILYLLFHCQLKMSYGQINQLGNY
jgi:hypothetical protein